MATSGDLIANTYRQQGRAWGSRATLDKHIRNIWPFRGIDVWVVAAGSMQAKPHWQIAKVTI